MKLLLSFALNDSWVNVLHFELLVVNLTFKVDFILVLLLRGRIANDVLEVWKKLIIHHYVDLSFCLLFEFFCVTMASSLENLETQLEMFIENVRQIHIIVSDFQPQSQNVLNQKL